MTPTFSLRRVFSAPSTRGWLLTAGGVKLILGALLGSSFLTVLFIPFLTLAVRHPGANPWQLAIEEGVLKAFPYGPVMYYAMVLPRWVLGWAIPWGVHDVTWRHLLAARLPLFAADLAVLALLIRSFGTPPRRTILLWWASPVVLYISYVHGQLDLIPTALLLGSLALLDRWRTVWSAVVLGLGVAAKTHLVERRPARVRPGLSPLPGLRHDGAVFGAASYRVPLGAAGLRGCGLVADGPARVAVLRKHEP